MIKIEATSKLVGKLQLDSEVLDLYHSDFMRLLAEGRFWVHTFQEAKPLNNVIGKVYDFRYPLRTRQQLTLLDVGCRRLQLQDR